MAASYKTPGVYIVEKNAFPNTVVEVATAVPAFIGYTETAVNNKKSLLFEPTRVTSFAEFLMYFGSGPNNGAPTPQYDLSINDNGEYAFSLDENPYLLYNSLRLFYANGGGPCYVVSVGLYGDDIEKGQATPPSGLIGGLTPLLKEQEPTMVVVPDAVRLGSPSDCYTVYNSVLLHCQKTQSRVGIFDVYDGYQARSGLGISKDVVDDFRNGVQQALNYGAAYYPWLNTNVVDDSEIDFRNLTPAARQLLGDMIQREGRNGQLQPQIDKVTSYTPSASLNGASGTAVAESAQRQLTAASPKKTDAEKEVDSAQTELTKKAKALAEEIEGVVTDAEAKDTATALKDKETIEPGDVEALEAAAATALKEKQADAATALEAYKADSSSDPQPAVDTLKETETKIGTALAETHGALRSYGTAQAHLARVNASVRAADREIAKLKREMDVTSLHQSLLAVSPTYRTAMESLKKTMNLMPAAAAMAGVYTRVDNNIGVYKAPANTGLVSVVSPAVNISHDEQEDLNVPLNGKAVNAIRSFPGYGVLVWGARTLDGNSQDWRYINVRRTLIMLEQSIKAAMQAYVFEPNTASTWSSVNSMISSFLTNQWKAGALAGAAPADAFEVHVGLGATMTPNDILDGYMRITVKVAIVRPAEFIVLTFQQKMQTS